MATSSNSQQQIRLVEKGEFWFVGVGSCGPYKSARSWVMKLWDTIVARADELPTSVNKTSFVSPCHGRTTEFTCYIGFEATEEVTAIPDGFVCFKIPARTYVVGTMRGKREEVDDIYDTLNRWRNAHSYEAIRNELWLEIYPERASHDPSAPLHFDVWLPIVAPATAVTNGGTWRPLGAVTHVQLPVSNVDEAAAWYREHLGFDLYRRPHDELAIMKLPAGPTLFLWKTADTTTGNFTKNGEVMPTIGISCKDANGLRAHLLAKGATITHFADEGFAIVMKFLDPYGNMFVVHQDHQT